MALDQNATYPVGTIGPSAAYPEGEASDSTVPGALDGFPWQKTGINDRLGMEQALLRSGGVAASGAPDTALLSQYVQMIAEIAQGRARMYDDNSVAVNAFVLDVQANQQGFANLFDGQEFDFIASITSTAACTVNPAGTGIKNIVNTATAGTIIAGHRYTIRYRLGTTDFEIAYSRGDIVQTIASVSPAATGAVVTGTTTVPLDDTIPQNTEGDEYMTVTITPQSASNKLIISAQAQISHTLAQAFEVMSLYQDAGADALTSASLSCDTANGVYAVNTSYEMVAGTIAAITFKIRIGADVAGTNTINGFSSGRKFGGALNTYLRVREVQQ